MTRKERLIYNAGVNVMLSHSSFSAMRMNGTNRIPHMGIAQRRTGYVGHGLRMLWISYPHVIHTVILFTKRPVIILAL